MICPECEENMDEICGYHFAKRVMEVELTCPNDHPGFRGILIPVAKAEENPCIGNYMSNLQKLLPHS